MTKHTEEELLTVINEVIVPYKLNLTDRNLRKHADQFITELKIEASTEEQTPCHLIYWKYLKWCKFHKEKPIARNRFFDGWSQFYRPYAKYIDKNTTEKGYYIKREQFNISQDEMELLWDYRDMERSKQRKRRKHLKQLREQRAQKAELLKMALTLVNTQE